MLIVLTLCHLLTKECREERMSDPHPPTPQSCMMAQPDIAQWVGEHFPDYRVARFNCVDPARMERRT